MITTKKEISIFNAIRALIPDAKLYVEDNSWDKIHWDDEREQPSRSDIEAKLKELQADYDSKQYQRDRATSYPSIQEQLDMQYHDAVNGTTTWKDAIAKVKTDNPKPSE
mgnify:CR=1 FL=1